MLRAQPSKFVRIAAGSLTDRTAQAKAAAPRGDERLFEHIDPNWVSVVLSIPGDILVAMELNKRLMLVERTGAMLVEVRRRLGGAGGVIRVGAAKSFDLATAKAKDIAYAIMDAAGGEDAGG